MSLPRSSPAALAVITFALVLALVWLAYRPGLGGNFLFDDYANLPSLGALGRVDNATTFWYYITSGSADPTGRPLALLSFLADANDWPADPYPFKRSNVLLHICNGVLLALLLRALGHVLLTNSAADPTPSERQRQCAARIDMAAVLGAALWLLHPLLVSTTLYVVQREAMLPATFILIGLLGYVGARALAARGRLLGVILAAFSIGVCTFLAVLSKANGVLLPLLAWIVESIVLAPKQPVVHVHTKRAFAAMRRLCLILPSFALFAYLAVQAWIGFVHGMPAIRPWTLGERLLTESRVLIDYLRLLCLPRPFTAGLFNDAFPVSTGWLSPPSTLFCVLGIAALLIAAFSWRRRHPAFAMAVLFYFAGQLLESTVVPLELYFEHRNYVPALLMFWPLTLWLCGVRGARGDKTDTVEPALTRITPSQPGPPSRDVRVAPETGTAMKGLALARGIFTGMLVLGLAGLTCMRASLWGDPHDQALLWAKKNPASPRAQAYAAQVEMDRGNVAAAITRLRHALEKDPNEIQLALNMVGAKCMADALTPIDLTTAANALRSAPNTGRLGYDWFERSLALAKNGTCNNLGLGEISGLLDAAASNPRAQKVSGRRQDVLHMQGRVALLQGNAERTLVLFNAALDADPRPGAALEQAAILASAGHPRLAMRHLDHLDQVWKPRHSPNFDMPSIHEWLLWRQGYWQHEISHLRGVLADDIARQSGSDPSTGTHGPAH